MDGWTDKRVGHTDWYLCSPMLYPRWLFSPCIALLLKGLRSVQVLSMLLCCTLYAVYSLGNDLDAECYFECAPQNSRAYVYNRYRSIPGTNQCIYCCIYDQCSKQKTLTHICRAYIIEQVSTQISVHCYVSVVICIFISALIRSLLDQCTYKEQQPSLHRGPFLNGVSLPTSLIAVHTPNWVRLAPIVIPWGQSRDQPHQSVQFVSPLSLSQLQIKLLVWFSLRQTLIQPTR